MLCIFIGQVLGNCVAMPITGAICASKGGWPMSFYFYGAVGLVWCLAFLLLGSNNPTEHKNISPWERDWIISGLAKENKEVSFFMISVKYLF